MQRFPDIFKTVLETRGDLGVSALGLPQPLLLHCDAVTPFFGISSILCGAFLVASLVLGHFNGELGLSPGHHLLVGLGGAIHSVAHHCLVFGIFTGSGKDTRELVQDLRLDPDYAAKTKAFRRFVFPVALYSILLLLITTTLGGALTTHSGSFIRILHLTLAWFTVLYNLRAFWIEFKAVRDNAQILGTVNEVATQVASREPALPPSEVPLLGTTLEKLEWGTHVYALGKFLCFLGFNAWLPFIYMRFIMGLFQTPLWPFLLASALCLLGGYYLRWRYRGYRPGELASPRQA